MRRRTLATAGWVLLLALAGCAEQMAKDDEEMLAAAGFRVLPIDTAERTTASRTLQPRNLIRTTHDGQLTWVYSDPEYCRCMYVGGEPQYQRYSQLRVQQRLALIQEQTAQLYYMNWGPWGPWGFWGW